MMTDARAFATGFPTHDGDRGTAAESSKQPAGNSSSTGGASRTADKPSTRDQSVLGDEDFTDIMSIFNRK